MSLQRRGLFAGLLGLTAAAPANAAPLAFPGGNLERLRAEMTAMARVASAELYGQLSIASSFKTASVKNCGPLAGMPAKTALAISDLAVSGKVNSTHLSTSSAADSRTLSASNSLSSDIESSMGSVPPPMVGVGGPSLPSLGLPTDDAQERGR